MTHWKTLAIALSLSAYVVGCDDPNPPAPAAPAPAAPTAAAAADDHGHTHEHGHEHDDAGRHTGERHDLGKKDIGGMSVQVTQIGNLKAGTETPFEIVVAGKPDAVRAWLGNEAGDGSVKVKAIARGEFYDADIEFPDKLPDGSKFWVEVETAAGKAKASFDAKL